AAPPDLSQAATTLRDRAAALGASQTLDTSSAADLRELEARSSLGASLEAILEEVRRQKRLAAYTVSFEDTSTTQITRKSTELTTRLVTDRLRENFQTELKRLEFAHLAVEVRSAGGTRGALFHKLVFSRAPNALLLPVLSEGESRTLALASFLAE